MLAQVVMGPKVPEQASPEKRGRSWSKRWAGNRVWGRASLILQSQDSERRLGLQPWHCSNHITIQLVTGLELDRGDRDDRLGS